jgi:CspA family cold shock protein
LPGCKTISTACPASLRGTPNNGYVWFYVVGDSLGKTNDVMSGPALQSPHFCRISSSLLLPIFVSNRYLLNSRIIFFQLKVFIMDKQQGTVKFFNTEKGFGFIKHNDSNKETFVNVSGLKSQNIKEGDIVEFDLQEGRKGMNAVNVEVVG